MSYSPYFDSPSPTSTSGSTLQQTATGSSSAATTPPSAASASSSGTTAGSSSSSSQGSDRRKTPSSWDPNDDVVLRHLKEQLKLGWKEIASHFPNRTTNACQFRWRRLMSGTLRNSSVSSSGTTSVQPTSPTATATTTGPLSTSAPNPSTNTGSSTSAGYPVSQALTTVLNHEQQRQQQQQHQQHQQQQQQQNESAQSHTIQPTTTGPASEQAQSAKYHSNLYNQLHSRPWTREEDELLMSRKDLRPEELSLLLHQRSEVEIRVRIEQLRAQGRILPPSPTSSPPPLAPSLTASSTSSLSSSLPSSYGNANHSPIASASPPTLRRPSKAFVGLRLPTPVPQRPAGSADTFSPPPLNISL